MSDIFENAAGQPHSRIITPDGEFIRAGDVYYINGKNETRENAEKFLDTAYDAGGRRALRLSKAAQPK